MSELNLVLIDDEVRKTVGVVSDDESNTMITPRASQPRTPARPARNRTTIGLDNPLNTMDFLNPSGRVAAAVTGAAGTIRAS